MLPEHGHEETGLTSNVWTLNSLLKTTVMIVELQILGVVIFAAFLGGITGIERELADKPAGLRTHMVVAATAALLISLANVIVPNLELNTDVVRTDPIRMIEAIVTGITFLGAGTIIRERSGIEGLTTAASLLFVAALGITAALSQYLLAVVLAILNLIILRGIKIFEKHVLDKKEKEAKE
jgi:putative Mg2+ transporter-C (MgtC) family protein